MRTSCLAGILCLLPAALHAQARVAPVFATGIEPGANVDSCAVWAAPEGVDSLLFITQKNGNRIEVWNASTGERYAPRPYLGETPESPLPGDFDRPNGVWVIYHVPYAAGFADVLLVTDQENLRVQVFRLPEMEYFGEFGAGEVGKGYGIAPYHDGTDLFVFITDNIPPAGFPGKLKKYRLRPGGGGLGADLISASGSSAGNPPLPNVESILADPFHDRLHVCGDEGGTRNFLFRLDGGYTGVSYGEAEFEFNQEGINLHDTGGGRGYIIVSDQHTNGTPNEFEVFDRATIAHIGAFTSTPGGAIVTTNTDGTYLEQRPFGRFPNGAFYAVNDDENAHAYDWTDVAEALGLEIVALDRSFPGRAGGGAAGSGRALWFHDGSWWGALPRGGELVISRLEDGAFAPILPIGDEAPAAVWSSGGELAVLEAGEAVVLRRFLHEPSLRRYAAAGGAVAVAAAEGPLADLAVEAGPAGEPARGWVAWASGNVLQAVSSGEGLTDWDTAGTPLGAAVALAPRLIRMDGATAVAWAEPGSVSFRVHRDEDPAGDWEPVETVIGSAAASLAAAALPDGRAIVAGSSAAGSGWIRVRSAAGAWSDRSLPGDVREVALSIDAERGRAHLFHAVEVSGRRVLHHRDAALSDLSFGAARLAAGRPGVDIEAVSHAGEIPPEATDAVAAVFGDDDLGLVARVPLPAGEDRTPPITLQHFPSPGAAAAEGTVLSFRITDDRSGVDRSRLRLLVNGEAVAPSVRGVPRNLIVTYVLAPGIGSTASIRIEAEDLAPAPHVMAPFEYEITVIGGGAPRFRRGDSNGDGRLDLSDGVRALLVLFAGAGPPACLDVLDANDDGASDVTDPIALLDHIFRQGPAPPAPGASCGVDPTEDDLPCPAAAPCG